MILNPAKLPSIDVLLKCRDGLTKKIKRAKKNLDKNRLSIIRDEIDYLIEIL